MAAGGLKEDEATLLDLDPVGELLEIGKRGSHRFPLDEQWRLRVLLFIGADRKLCRALGAAIAPRDHLVLPAVDQRVDAAVLGPSAAGYGPGTGHAVDELQAHALRTLDSDGVATKTRDRHQRRLLAAGRDARPVELGWGRCLGSRGQRSRQRQCGPGEGAYGPKAEPASSY